MFLAILYFIFQFKRLCLKPKYAESLRGDHTVNPGLLARGYMRKIRFSPLG